MFAAVEDFVVFIIIVIVILLILSTCIRVVPQAQALIVERLGTYQRTYGVRIHLLIPFINRVVKKADLKGQVEDFPPQPVIIRDNVTIQIDAVVFFYITDPKLYAYGVGRPLLVIENLTVTTLRNIIGNLELDQVLTSRETINAKVQELLDIAVDPRGIKVTRVKLKNIIPPSAIQETMEKQMKAERERRKSTFHVEDEKRSMILVAGDNKESVVFNAEAEKEATILRVETEKEKEIKEAQDQVEAIRSVQQTTADDIHFIKETGVDNVVLQLKNLEAFQAATDGKTNKIIIPSDIQGITGAVRSITEITAKDEGAE